MHNYKIWQQFPQDLLKSTLTNMKEHRMVRFFREQRKLSLAPYRLSLHFICSQSATFTHRTMEEAFAAFEELKSGSSEKGVDNEYGHMFGFNEVGLLISFFYKPNRFTYIENLIMASFFSIKAYFQKCLILNLEELRNFHQLHFCKQPFSSQCTLLNEKSQHEIFSV